MPKVHAPVRSGKRLVSERRQEQLAALEHRAFEAGKVSGLEPRPSLAPYREDRLVAAWMRGAVFRWQENAGLRPLDTVRRVA